MYTMYARMVPSIKHQGQQPAVRAAEASYADETVTEDVLQLAHLRAHAHLHIHAQHACTCTCDQVLCMCNMHI